MGSHGLSGQSYWGVREGPEAGRPCGEGSPGLAGLRTLYCEGFEQTHRVPQPTGAGHLPRTELLEDLGPQNALNTRGPAGVSRDRGAGGCGGSWMNTASLSSHGSPARVMCLTFAGSQAAHCSPTWWGSLSLGVYKRLLGALEKSETHTQEVGLLGRPRVLTAPPGAQFVRGQGVPKRKLGSCEEQQCRLAWLGCPCGPRAGWGELRCACACLCVLHVDTGEALGLQGAVLGLCRPGRELAWGPGPGSGGPAHWGLGVVVGAWQVPPLAATPTTAGWAGFGGRAQGRH